MDYSTMGRLGNLAKLQKYTPAEMTAKANNAQRAKLTARIDPDGSLRRDDPQLFAKRYNAALSERGLRAAEARWGAYRRRKANAAIVEIVEKPLTCAWCAKEQGKKIGRTQSGNICAPHKAAWMAKAQKIHERGARLEPDTAL